MPSIPLAEFLSVFLRAGNLTFGGGDPTMAVLHRETVERRPWLSPEQYGMAYGLARVTPGTNILAFCAAVGWYLLRWPGAVIAVLAVSAPSGVLVAWLTASYESVKTHPLVAAALGGAVAAAIGMMCAAAWKLVSPHLRRGRTARTLIIFLGSGLLLWRFSLSPLAILALAAAAGWLWPVPEET